MTTTRERYLERYLHLRGIGLRFEDADSPSWKALYLDEAEQHALTARETHQRFARVVQQRNAVFGVAVAALVALVAVIWGMQK